MHSFNFAASLVLALLAVVVAGPGRADDRAGGFALGVTGGGDAPVQVPASPAELAKLLCDRIDASGRCVDETPRVIRLDRAFDFSGTEGVARERGCIVRQCGPAAASELALDVAAFCTQRTATDVSYDKAGRKPLLVGSNKTLIGTGRDGAIKGKGLAIKGGAHNVIIRNLAISDINPQVVWGGDALTIDDADGVWIDHNVFARIGRQMIVTGFGSAAHVTLSNNLFDGRTSYGAYCDGHHYWLMLFLGAHDQITVARNWIRGTSGRGPHAGGMRGAAVDVHLVNNYYQDVTAEGAANALTASAHLLMEGNVFADVTHPVYRHGDDPGAVFAPFAASGDATAAACRTYLGRDCVANQGNNSGADPQSLDVPALAALAAHGRRYLVAPMPASDVPARVAGEAGTGRIR
jgi:pectin lyase